MTKKKALGPLLAVLFVSIILTFGYFVGKEFALKYNEKHQTNKNVFQILKEVIEHAPINYILESSEKTLSELCGKDTGICDQQVGTITLDNTDIKMHIYSKFDNPDDEATTYFKLNNTKIGSFVYLDKFTILNKKYLMITEPNSYNDNYIIHLYDKSGKEVASYEATKRNEYYRINNNELYFSYCNVTDSEEVDGISLPRVSEFKINTDDITKKEEISYEYKNCV